MKNFLVPVDFSEYGKAAKDTAIAIAAQNGAEVDFLHCMNLPKFTHISNIDTKDLPEEYRVEKGKAQQLLNDYKKEAEGLGITAKSYLSYSKSTTEITLHAENHNTDLIIMGSHGSSGFREAFLGSNTQRVLRMSSSPVLVIKQKPKSLNFKHIVFAATFKEDVHAPFHKVLDFAKSFGAQLHLLYINLPYNFEETATSLARMDAFAKMYPGNNLKLHIYNAFDEESGILNFSHENAIDVIATTTHGKSGFAQIMSPSITESLANHSSIPVLSVNMNR